LRKKSRSIVSSPIFSWRRASSAPLAISAWADPERSLENGVFQKARFLLYSWHGYSARSGVGFQQPLIAGRLSE
jgi:hypothetical protein